jgi:hypothetical protein
MIFPLKIVSPSTLKPVERCFSFDPLSQRVPRAMEQVCFQIVIPPDEHAETQQPPDRCNFRESGARRVLYLFSVPRRENVVDVHG